MKQLGIKAAAASRMFERARAETSRRVASRHVASRRVTSPGTRIYRLRVDVPPRVTRRARPVNCFVAASAKAR